MKMFFQKETSGEGSNASIVNLKNTTSKTNPHSFNNPFVNSMETAEISHVFNTPGSVISATEQHNSELHSGEQTSSNKNTHRTQK